MLSFLLFLALVNQLTSAEEYQNNTFVLIDNELQMQSAVTKLGRTVSLFRNAKPMNKWGGYMTVIDPGTTEMDPFIFLVHHVHKFSPGERTGFPPHPHRGFETVTYAIEGGFEHGDSKGNKGTYGDGDVQWMTAGSGVLHSEMFLTDAKKASSFNGFQIWLNLPSRLKMSEPAYEMLWNKDIPKFELSEGQEPKPFASSDAFGDPVNSKVEKGSVTVKVISGRVNDAKAKVEKSTPVVYLHAIMKPNSKWLQEIPKEHHALLYVLEGKVMVGPKDKQKTLERLQYCMLNEDGDLLNLETADSKADFLVLSGKPFKEPVAHQGPFVMNTREELMQAMVDYQMGKFGYMDESDY